MAAADKKIRSAVFKQARGSICTTMMEFVPQNRSRDGFFGPNSIMVVHMDPLGKQEPCRQVYPKGPST